jgi:hypothetical protein
MTDRVVRTPCGPPCPRYQPAPLWCAPLTLLYLTLAVKSNLHLTVSGLVGLDSAVDRHKTAELTDKRKGGPLPPTPWTLGS